MTPESLRQHRQSLGLNLREYGEYLGCTGAAIWNWENGKQRVPQVVLNLINTLKVLHALQNPTLSLPIPPGLCQCGCNQPTAIAWRTDNQKKWVKGTPLAFLKGHNLDTRRAAR